MTLDEALADARNTFPAFPDDAFVLWLDDRIRSNGWPPAGIEWGGVPLRQADQRLAEPQVAQRGSHNSTRRLDTDCVRPGHADRSGWHRTEEPHVGVHPEHCQPLQILPYLCEYECNHAGNCSADANSGWPVYHRRESSNCGAPRCSESTAVKFCRFIIQCLGCRLVSDNQTISCMSQGQPSFLKSINGKLYFIM
jgi:hypothetical protein